MTGRRPERPTELGGLLRHWRKVRGRSQLDLSIDAGISQRHISFVESGRSQPSRRALLDLAQALDVPLRDRNVLLVAAGYAPVFTAGAWNAPEMAAVTAASRRILRQHEPYPAIAMDRYWNILMSNDAAPAFFGLFVDMAARRPPRNMLHLIFDPEGLRPFVADWDMTARSLLDRVHREAIAGVLDETTKRLLADLLAYPGVGADAGRLSTESALPIIPLGFVRDGMVLNYFSMVTTVGTPRAIAAQEMRIETMFPADEATERAHCRLVGEASDTAPLFRAAEGAADGR